MYLHVGNKRYIREKNILGIFDMDNATVAGQTRSFLAQMQNKGLVESARREEIPKSFVLYEEHAKEKSYKLCFSQLSSIALLHRSTKGTKES